MTRPLRILEWNANGIRREILEFTQLLHIHKIDIALISETKISDEATWRSSEYEVWKTEGPIRGHGGTAVVVKSTITHSPITANGLESIQLMAIELYPRNRRITIGSVYIPPSKDLLRTYLDTLTRYSNDFIIGGDLTPSTLIGTPGQIIEKDRHYKDNLWTKTMT